MSGLFYQLGRLAGPKIRKARWAYLAATAPRQEVIAAEVKVGSDMVRALQDTIRFSQDESSNTIMHIGDSLAKCVGKNSRPFSFQCYIHDQPQAFCLPGGIIFIGLRLYLLTKWRM